MRQLLVVLGMAVCSITSAMAQVSAGICGLAVLTMAVTYLIEVQEGVSQRDRGVLKITTASGAIKQSSAIWGTAPSSA